MAKTKAAGSSRLGRDSLPKYLGLKVGPDEMVLPGMILVRQRGSKFLPGQNVKQGADDTLYSLKKGQVVFTVRSVRSFDGARRLAKVINVFDQAKA